MTTLNLPSPPAKSRDKTIVRPMHVRRDARQVISLLELVFNQHLRNAGHHTITPGFSLRDFIDGRSQLVPGFVYSFNQHIVGNVSLIESRMRDRYLIANVAVHPDFRRKGIARSMMIEVINYIANRDGKEVSLQVETQNQGAYNLYRQLGFVDAGEVRDWRMNWYALKSVASPPTTSRSKPDDYGEFILRPLRSDDAKAALALDHAVFPKSLNWPDTPILSYYQRAGSSLISRLLTGNNNEIWVAANRADQIVGIGVIENEFGRPYNMKIRIHPDWVDFVERPLVAKIMRRFRYLRSKTITIQQNVNQHHLEPLLREAGFSLKRNLTVMNLEL